MLHAVVITDVVRSPDLIVASTDLVRDALVDAGCAEVTGVTTASAAALLAKLQPDLVVLDLIEPPPFEAYRRLIARLRGAPLLAIVAEAHMQSAFDAGVDDCLARPVRRAELVARACSAIRLRIERARRTKRDRRLTDEMRALQREKHDLERIACVDPLTGVANRRHALSLFDGEWKRSAREGHPVSLVMLDLDCFHAFNESYGHPGGDVCLRRVAAEMVMSLRRPSDVLGRYGGEEFMAVLGNTGAAGARIVAERLRVAVESLAIPHGSSSASPVVTISVGFATADPKPELAPDALVQAADRALLAAKSGGRNRVCGDTSPSEAGPSRPRTMTQPREFPVVIAEPWFADRIPPFLEATRDLMRAARTACELGSFDRIRAIARRIKSNATEHGIDAIGELASTLERAARAGDRAAAERASADIEQYVDHVRVTYRRPLERRTARERDVVTDAPARAR